MLVKRQKTSIFIDAKQESTVLDVKKMLEGIVKKTLKICDFFIVMKSWKMTRN